MIDKEAFLINLTKSRIFPSKNTGTEVYSASNLGPSFSANYGNELSAYLSPFNGEKHCRSYANNTTYCIDVDEDDINMLTNKKDGRFTITKLEVWEITFIY